MSQIGCRRVVDLRSVAVIIMIIILGGGDCGGSMKSISCSCI